MSEPGRGSIRNGERQQGSSGLDVFFFPTSVAVVGASADPRKTGHAMVKNLLEYGYGGSIYPINAAGLTDLLGLKVYRTLLDVPGGVDLAVLTVAAASIPGVIAECVEKRVRGAIIHTVGFAESGPEGRRLQEEIVRMARGGGLRLLGPNCVGTLCPEGHLPWLRRSTFPSYDPQAAAVGVISQSGGGGGSFVNLALHRGLSFSKVISLGNACDVSISECLGYLGDDPATRMIFLYLEGLTDGRRFFQVARRITPEKPVLVYKIGRTGVGQQAAASHTGSLAGSLQVYDGVFKQCGVLRPGGIEEAIDLLVAFSHLWFGQRPLAGDRVGIISGPGGPGVATADACVEAGLQVPDYSPRTKARLTEAIPTAAPANPTEIGDFSFVASIRERDPYGAMVEIVAEDEQIDALAIVGPGEYQPEGFMEVVRQIRQACPKPFVVIWPSAGREVDCCKEALQQAGVPLFSTPERGASALGGLAHYGRRRQRLLKGLGDAASTRSNGEVGAGAVLQGRDRGSPSCGVGDGGLLTEPETKRLLAAYGIPVTREAVATSATMAGRIADQIGFPVVLKIVSPDLPHKSEVGGVRLNVGSRRQVQQVYREILAAVSRARPQARVEGVLVQQMLPPGHEVIVGLHHDPTFGPVIMFGLGGIWVEVFNDVTFRLLPLTRADAEGMVEEVKGYRLLKEDRGGLGTDLETLVEVLLAVSRLGEERREIATLDINPLILNGQGAVAADAVIYTV